MSQRRERLNALLRQILGELVLTKLSDPRIDRAHQPDQFVMYDFDHHLVGMQGGQHLGPESLLQNVVAESAHDLYMHVGLEQGGAYLAQGVLDVGFGDAATSAHLMENVVKSFAKGVKHAFYHRRRTPQRPSEPIQQLS